jgi:hypothetical protein
MFERYLSSIRSLDELSIKNFSTRNGKNQAAERKKRKKAEKDAVRNGMRRRY